jgi:hypothetical protein
VTKTQVPAHPDDLICQTCPERFHFRGSLITTRDLARTQGWHIYSDSEPHRVLCPACIGTNRTRIPAPPILAGQSDILTDLGITAEITTEVNTSKRKRRDGA